MNETLSFPTISNTVMPSANLIIDSAGTGKAEWFREQKFLAMRGRKLRTKQSLISLADARISLLREIPLEHPRLTSVLTRGGWLNQKNAFQTGTLPTKAASKPFNSLLYQDASKAPLENADSKPSRSQPSHRRRNQ